MGTDDLFLWILEQIQRQPGNQINGFLRQVFELEGAIRHLTGPQTIAGYYQLLRLAAKQADPPLDVYLLVFNQLDRHAAATALSMSDAERQRLAADYKRASGLELHEQLTANQLSQLITRHQARHQLA